MVCLENICINTLQKGAKDDDDDDDDNNNNNNNNITALTTLTIATRVSALMKNVSVAKSLAALVHLLPLTSMQ
jgi:hypothetical protein